MSISVTILGCGPLPLDRDTPFSAAGLRTYQFAYTTHHAGYTVTTVCVDASPKGIKTKEMKRRSPCEGFQVISLSFDDFANGKILEEIIERSSPDVLVATGSILPVYTATHYSREVPFWTDILGDPLLEVQAKAPTQDPDKLHNELFHVWKMLNRGLFAGDVFSAVSLPQSHALIGQLTLIGRLNHQTEGYEFVHSIPLGILEEEKGEANARGEADPFVRGAEIAPDDFIICWSGSYNTWIDIDTLFLGVEGAMKRSQKVKFLSLGGAIAGYEEQMYQRFVKRIEGSSYRENFILKDWITPRDMRRAFQECDVGINVDRFTYEAYLGSRSRLVGFYRFGVPAISTVMTELTQALSRVGALYEFKMGHPASLTETILRAMEDTRERKEKGRKGRTFVFEEYSFSKTMKPFLAWLESPTRAPDKNSIFRNSLNEIERLSCYDLLQQHCSASSLKSSLRNRLKHIFRS